MDPDHPGALFRDIEFVLSAVVVAFSVEFISERDFDGFIDSFGQGFALNDSVDSQTFFTAE